MDPFTPHVSNESPQARHHILGSFLRGRPRGTSSSNLHLQPPNQQPHSPREDQPQSPVPSPPSPGPGHRRSPAAVAAGGIQASVSQNSGQVQQGQTQAQPQAQSSGGAAAGLAQMLRRRRSAGALPTSGAAQAASATSPNPNGATPASVPASSAIPRSNLTPPQTGTAQGHRIRLVPQVDTTRRSLRFDPISRDLKPGDSPLRIGRFTDRLGLGIEAANALGSNKLAFKSKVVSRSHAEIWVEGGGRWWIKDTKSSSGTFLNHVRLSPAGTESRAHEIRDGDVVQLGVDYQGGAEDIYKCVKMRLELGREWQAGANVFNTNALKQLKALAIPSVPQTQALQTAIEKDKKIVQKSGMADCCICLFAVTLHQALFIAPCSHCYHFKCIRPLIEANHPSFSCPICRTYADLEDDVEVEVEYDAQSVSEDADMVEGPEAELPPVAIVAAALEQKERERERVREGRERGDREMNALNAGAETEVEAEPSGSRGIGMGMPSRSRNPFMNGGFGMGIGRSVTMTNGEPSNLVDLTGGDHEALGAEAFHHFNGSEPALPPLPEGEDDGEGDDVDALMVVHDGERDLPMSVSRENSPSPDFGTGGSGGGHGEGSAEAMMRGISLGVRGREGSEEGSADGLIVGPIDGVGSGSEQGVGAGEEGRNSKRKR
ncbi:hypothetical protein JAAARDRAFT_197059 [Jaapia argillacea MUCL 33604]|uniref:FHA domain-containing protein n=1 Tax=Jaapia argillacea MUCL 33604 TaxID=933084 RepID=A0A067PRN5_9AGAM|nr:hypothetical protein JAAARDRAFT_197059 [Jaapia argillacea MUCL 33604]